MRHLRYVKTFTHVVFHQSSFSLYFCLRLSLRSSAVVGSIHIVMKQTHPNIGSNLSKGVEIDLSEFQSVQQAQGQRLFFGLFTTYNDEAQRVPMLPSGQEEIQHHLYKANVMRSNEGTVRWTCRNLPAKCKNPLAFQTTISKQKL